MQTCKLDHYLYNPLLIVPGLIQIIRIDIIFTYTLMHTFITLLDGINGQSRLSVCWRGNMQSSVQLWFL